MTGLAEGVLFVGWVLLFLVFAGVAVAAIAIVVRARAAGRAASSGSRRE